MASPLPSTAAQKFAEGHDTDEIGVLGSICWGADQITPLNVRTLPKLSPTMQNVGETQDTESSAVVPSIFVIVQVEPSYTNAFPWASTATQNAIQVQDTPLSVPWLMGVEDHVGEIWAAARDG